jgi:hypothetical protein
MYFDQNMIIDATRGSIARFVNHSCEPNCRMEKWTVSGKPRMALFAGESGIMTGEELTYDYNFEYACPLSTSARSPLTRVQSLLSEKRTGMPLRHTIMSWYPRSQNERCERKEGSRTEVEEKETSSCFDYFYLQPSASGRKKTQGRCHSRRVDFAPEQETEAAQTNRGISQGWFEESNHEGCPSDEEGGHICYYHQQAKGYSNSKGQNNRHNNLEANQDKSTSPPTITTAAAAEIPTQKDQPSTGNQTSRPNHRRRSHVPLQTQDDETEAARVQFHRCRSQGGQYT